MKLWFEQFIANLGPIPSAVICDGIEKIAIAEGTYEGKANPHAWIGPKAALIYVDNIRDALSKHDPDKASIYAANAETYKATIRATIDPLRKRHSRNS